MIGKTSLLEEGKRSGRMGIQSRFCNAFLLCVLLLVVFQDLARAHNEHPADTRSKAVLHDHKMGSHAHPLGEDPNHTHLDRNDSHELVSGPPPVGADGSWTVVVVPDTQNYMNTINNVGASKRSYKGEIEVLETSYKWMAQAKEERNIQLVAHVGDMTNDNTAREWEAIRRCYNHIDGVIPYVVCVGNHDVTLGENNALLDDYFKISDNPLNERIFGGYFEEGNLENAYYTFEQNGQKFLFLALEWAVRQEVVDWADKLCKQYADHRVFIMVHEYLSEKTRMLSVDDKIWPEYQVNEKQKRVAAEKGVEFNFGYNLRRELIEQNSNIEFLVGGHYGCTRFSDTGELEYDIQELATAHYSSEREGALTFHAMLFNAQWLFNGGNGWILLLEFGPDNDSVQAYTYSPYLNAYRVGPEYQYSLERSSDW